MARLGEYAVGGTIKFFDRAPIIWMNKREAAHGQDRVRRFQEENAI